MAINVVNELRPGVPLETERNIQTFDAGLETSNRKSSVNGVGFLTVRENLFRLST